MPIFNSLSDLNKHLQSKAGTSALLNQNQIKVALVSEMERLQKYLVEEMNSYLSSYQPVSYERTGAWMESVRVNSVVQVGNQFSISLTFDDSFAYHPSYLGSDQPDGYVPWLFEAGWDIRDKFGGLDNRFTHFEGTHYIKNAVARWNSSNRFGFKIYVYRGNERYI